MNAALTLLRLAQKHRFHEQPDSVWSYYAGVARERIGLFRTPYDQWPEDQRPLAQQALFMVLDTVGEQLAHGPQHAFLDELRRVPGIEDPTLRRMYQRHRTVARANLLSYHLVPDDPVAGRPNDDAPDQDLRGDDPDAANDAPRRRMRITVGPVSEEALNVRLVFDWSIFRRKHAFDVAWAERAPTLAEDLVRLRGTDQAFEKRLAGIAGDLANWPGEADLARHERARTGDLVKHWAGRMTGDQWRRAAQNPDLVLTAVREALVQHGLSPQAWEALILGQDASLPAVPAVRSRPMR